MKKGDEVLYHPKKGRPMQAVVRSVMGNGTVELVIGSDPFPVTVNDSQVSDCNGNGKVVESKAKVRKGRTNKEGKSMPKTDKGPSAKELRKQAQGLGIDGWEDMSRKEMRRAIKRAKAAQNGDTPTSTKEDEKVSKPKPKTKPKASSTKPKATTKKAAPKAAAKKAAPKASAKAAVNDAPGLTFAKSHPKPTPEHGVNPFRKNSALFKVAKLLLKGGKRETLASKLSETVELHPYQKDTRDVDLLDYDKRLLLGAQTMRDKFGYGVLRTGRGLDGTILVFVPGGPTDPRGKSSKSKAKKK